MEQWEAYGHEYYEMNANVAQGEIPQHPIIEEAVEKVKIHSVRTKHAFNSEMFIIDTQQWIRKIYWVVILLVGFISVFTFLTGAQGHDDFLLFIGVLLAICATLLFIIVHFYLPRKWKKKALNRSRVAWRTGGHSKAVGIMKAQVKKHDSDLEFASELEMILSQVETTYRYQD
jgi:hypothetical protein